jgi:hypothetical protein
VAGRHEVDVELSKCGVALVGSTPVAIEHIAGVRIVPTLYLTMDLYTPETEEWVDIANAHSTPDASGVSTIMLSEDVDEASFSRTI